MKAVLTNQYGPYSKDFGKKAKKVQETRSLERGSGPSITSSEARGLERKSGPPITSSEARGFERESGPAITSSEARGLGRESSLPISSSEARGSESMSGPIFPSSAETIKRVVSKHLESRI